MLMYNFVSAFVACLVIILLGEVLSKFTKGWVPSVFISAVLILIAFWTFLPKTLVADSKLLPLGSSVAIFLLITHMGTLFSLERLLQQWKTVVICIAGLAGLVGLCWFVGPLFMDRTLVIAGIPPLAGGIVATTMMQKAALDAGLAAAAVFAIVMYCVQGFAGYPLTAVCLKLEARRQLAAFRAGKVEDKGEDARKVMANVRHRYFPILDANGKYCGVISRRNLLNVHRKQVIMVDHNERGQAVDGLEQAEILEIIDHHRLGALETAGPVYFRNEPVGCTATIISRMYEEHGVEIPPQIAGLLLSAILSDTLMFRSPTSTPLDQHIAEKLARIAGEEIPTYAEQMFEAGADLTGRTADDVFFSDFKVFSRGDAKFGVGQAIYMTSNSRSAAEALITPFLPEALAQAGVPMVFFMCTDMRAQATDLLFCGQQAEDIVRSAFHVETKDGKAVLPGVVSRKKQLIPPLMAALQALQA